MVRKRGRVEVSSGTEFCSREMLIRDNVLFEELPCAGKTVDEEAAGVPNMRRRGWLICDCAEKLDCTTFDDKVQAFEAWGIVCSAR